MSPDGAAEAEDGAERPLTAQPTAVEETEHPPAVGAAPAGREAQGMSSRCVTHVLTEPASSSTPDANGNRARLALRKWPHEDSTMDACCRWSNLAATQPHF